MHSLHDLKVIAENTKLVGEMIVAIGAALGVLLVGFKTASNAFTRFTAWSKRRAESKNKPAPKKPSSAFVLCFIVIFMFPYTMAVIYGVYDDYLRGALWMLGQAFLIIGVGALARKPITHFDLGMVLFFGGAFAFGLYRDAMESTWDNRLSYLEDRVSDARRHAREGKIDKELEKTRWNAIMAMDRTQDAERKYLDAEIKLTASNFEARLQALRLELLNAAQQERAQSKK